MTTTAAPEHIGQDAQTQPGWAFLRSRRWLGYYALLLIFTLACVGLADWQFERRALARAEIVLIDTNYDAPPAPLEDVLPDPQRFDEATQKWRTVRVTGTYLEEAFLARNRPGPGGVGSHLIQPLRTADGLLIFIDRGWVDVGASQLDAEGGWTADLPLASGAVTVDVRLRASEPVIAGRSSQGRTVASINAPELARLSGAPDQAYLGAYGMLIAETPTAETGILPAKPERDEGPHLSYALQWYVFILIAVLGVGYAARQEHLGLNSSSADVIERHRRSAERRRRRGPSDADEEDAILGA